MATEHGSRAYMIASVHQIVAEVASHKPSSSSNQHTIPFHARFGLHCWPITIQASDITLHMWKPRGVVAVMA